MSGSPTGDNFTTRELRTLGRYKHLGLMKYQDLEAYYCTGCNTLYNVKCANCGVKTTYKDHLPLYSEEKMFSVQQPLAVRKEQGLFWTSAECRKCDFKFLVIVR